MISDKIIKSSPPQKMKNYASFWQWEEAETQINELTTSVSEFVQTMAPDLEKIVKWGQGCFLKNGTPIIYIHTEPDHIQLGFYNGASLEDPNKNLEGKGKFIRHLKLVSIQDLQDKNPGFYIKQVI